MLPDGERNSAGNSHDQSDHDPYLVAMASKARKSKQAQSENIRAVVDEMQGTALRRRTQLLKSDN